MILASACLCLNVIMNIYWKRELISIYSFFSITKYFKYLKNTGHLTVLRDKLD